VDRSTDERESRAISMNVKSIGLVSAALAAFCCAALTAAQHDQKNLPAKDLFETSAAWDPDRARTLQIRLERLEKR